ncbi:MAG TPA: hypothetical protein VFD30_15350 [Terriglobia bacterium]|jgi:hypothetical protein|nr:hypothetical protein [Terriglobia bacterium]
MPDPDIHLAENDQDAGTLSFRMAFAVWGVISVVALGNLHFFYSRGLSNLYGDAIAHMEGARRLIDSVTPGYEEIGTVWLPLFHLVTAPLAQNDFLWRTGLAGGMVSTLAFAVTAWTLFLLGFEMNRTLAGGLLSLAGFLFCPNMLYLATTPLTEPLALMWSVLVVYGIFRFQVTGRRRALVGGAVAAFLGTLTRYDEWYVLPFAVLAVLLARRDPWRERLLNAGLFTLIAGSGPLLWFLHNAWRYENPLEFYNGPYSAQAIYAHQRATTAFPYPTDGHMVLSARYYLEDLKLVIGPWPLLLTTLGIIAWCVDRAARGRRSTSLLLAVPLPFYIHAMAYAAIPLYVPTLFPHTYYNVRYGLEMLPAAALLPSFVIGNRISIRLRRALLLLLLGVLGWQAVTTALPGPADLIVAKEGILNNPCRSERQQAVIQFFRANYDGNKILMAVGKWLCLMPSVGIPYANTLTNANRKYRLRLRTEPQKWVEWIIRSDGDDVDEMMRAYPQAFVDFDLVRKYAFRNGPSVEIYRRRPL